MSGLSLLVSRRAVADYARRPLNLVLLVAVPVVLVFVWGGTLDDFSELVGSTASRVQVEAATAGWAAALLAGLGGFFQVSGARATDRRLAAAGGRALPVITGRIGATLVLAALASAGGLIALAARTGIDDPVRALSGTLLVAVIYVAIGVLIGTLVRSDMNGALLVTFAWTLDVFLGPGLSGGSSVLTRVLPLHFPTLVLTSQASGHAGPLGDIGWSAAWAAGLFALAIIRLSVTTRPETASVRTWSVNAGAVVGPLSSVSDVAPDVEPRPAAVRPVLSARRSAANVAAKRSRMVAVLRAGMRDHRRNRVLWALLVVVPTIFIGLAIAVTVDTPGAVDLVDGGTTFTSVLSERRMHAATMVPVTAAFLAGLTGLFVVTGSAAADKRLVLAGLRPREILGGRLGIIGVATALTTAVAVAVSGSWYPPEQWGAFFGANLLIAATYAMIGVLVGPLTGRLGGLYLLLLLAFIDVGLGQTIMFPGGPPAWGAFLPGRGASRVLIDGAFTSRFDEGPYLLLGLVWLLGLTFAAAAVFHRQAGLRSMRAPPSSF